MANIIGFIRILGSKKTLDAIVLVVAILMITYHLLSGFFILQGNTTHLATHLTFVLVLGLLNKYRDDTKLRRYVALGFFPVAIVVMTYIFNNWERLEGSFGFIDNLDFAMGIALVAVVFVTAWLWWGLAIPIMIALAIAYFTWGHFLPGYMYHPEFSSKYLVSSLGISLTTGIFSSLLAVSANNIIYFMIFGAMVEAMGVMPGFLEMGKWIGRRLAGGPAYMALVGSAAVASISGAGTGNVAITGTFTIPAMKSAGFHPDHAGAIECVSSSGGPITPPVMGAAAFIMAAFLGVPYFVIMQKAVMGALIFYIIGFITIFFYSYATNKQYYVGPVSAKILLARLPIFVAGLAVVLAMLMRAYSIAYACSTAVFVVVTLALILLPEARSYKAIMNGLVKGAIWGTQVGIILSIIGILATTATATGLAPKGTAALFALTGGALLPSLLMIAVLGIILGMGIPMSAAYTVVAIMLVPGLRKLGVDLIAAHFFALYYSAYSILTPPYAPAAMVASRLSGGNFWRTGLMAMKFMIIPFFLPFVIALHPKLMNFPFIGLHEFILILVVLLAGVNIATALFNWFLTRLNRFTRSLAIIAALGNLAFTLDLGLFPLIIGLPCMAMMVFLQAVTFLTQRRRDLESSPVRDGQAVS